MCIISDECTQPIQKCDGLMTISCRTHAVGVYTIVVVVVVLNRFTLLELLLVNTSDVAISYNCDSVTHDDSKRPTTSLT
jgi:hypothetical protein